METNTYKLIARYAMTIKNYAPNETWENVVYSAIDFYGLKYNERDFNIIKNNIQNDYKKDYLNYFFDTDEAKQ